MPTFGLSAYLKLLLLNEKPRLSEIRRRIRGSEKGYDFHRSLRLRTRRLLVDGEPVADVLASIASILRAPEQKSVKVGLEQLAKWRASYPGQIMHFDSVLYESPRKVFRVNFSPDFGIRIKDKRVAVHVWNTASPLLSRRIACSTLSLFRNLYGDTVDKPDDLAILSLKNLELYRLDETTETDILGERLAVSIEEIFQALKRDVSTSTPKSEDRPDMPPPPGV